MSTYSWLGQLTGASGAWNAAFDWTSPSNSFHAPGSGDTVSLGWGLGGAAGSAKGGAYTVVTRHFSSYTVANLDMWSLGSGPYNAPMLDVSKGASFTVTGDLGTTNGLGSRSVHGGFIHLWNGASLTVGGSVAAGETVWFHGTPDTLNLGAVSMADPTAFAGQIRGFGVHDKIDLTSVAWQRGFHASYDYATHELMIHTSRGQLVAEMNVMFAPGTDGADHINVRNVDGHLEITICCFAVGTRILTPRGEVAVEDLREGDEVVTFAGKGEAHKAIKWIGQRVIDLESHPAPEAARPIRIRRGAFAEAVPHRDLLVSPDHAVFVDGVLIPAKCLVNGVTILQDDRFEDVHYFHVELDAHDVVMSEGLLTETYLDTGNRDMFEGDWAMVLHPMFEVRGSDRMVAPLVTNDAPVAVRGAERQAA